jgi:Subtilase family
VNRALAVAIGALVALGLWHVAAAKSEIAIPSQAAADGGAFLSYAPPPPQRAGLCLVDTGVNLNPDTEDVVDRTAIDGGSGDDTSSTAHGTTLAMMAAAPANGWGMVGAAPEAVGIISVRILGPGKMSFPFSSYAAGITTCLELRKKYDVRVINLSLGTSEVPSSEAYELVANAAERADDYGVAVVAAAGNDDGGPVGYPAAYPAVLSVGASDAQSGGFCSFSNRGPGLRLLAPGCDLDGADPTSGAPLSNYFQGTSESSDISAAALAGLDSYRPDLSPVASEELVTGADGGVLNIAQAFRNAGLSAIVAAGEAAEPHPTSDLVVQDAPQGVGPSVAMNLKARFARPDARLKRVGRRLLLVLSGRPSGAQSQVRLLGHRPHSRRLRVLRTIQGAFHQLLVPKGVTGISVRYVDVHDVERAGPWAMLRTAPARARGSK